MVTLAKDIAERSEVVLYVSSTFEYEQECARDKTYADRHAAPEYPYRAASEKWLAHRDKLDEKWEKDYDRIDAKAKPGEAGGDAVRDLLLGNANPCGKLAETWPVTYADCVSNSYYAGTKKDAHYREGVYVGYRYYATAGVPVRYPFGFGLSYTGFAYSDIEIDGDTVSCTVANVGTAAGKEIVELYVAPPKGEFYRPAREMKGFCKVSLEPGESKRVSFVLSDRSFAVWNGAWIVPGGTYTVFIGGNSENLPLSAYVKKENIPLSA